VTHARYTSEMRDRFPSLADGFVFMDNAGGSQVPVDVIDAVADYFRTRYVQVGADYPASERATATVAAAHRFIEGLMGGMGQGSAILGSSTSQLMQTLADAYARALPPSAEIIVAESGHEANVGPWVRMESRGFRVHRWLPNAEGICDLNGLEPLLNARTAIVAFPHVSNLLGCVEDIAPLTVAAHEVGAKVVVDGVAYAPHLPMQVAEWGVDWYAFSCYKVFAPHIAALWGRHASFEGLEGPNHFFVPTDAQPYKFELGGVVHESCAGLLGTQRYLGDLGGMRRVAELEAPLTARLLEYLRAKPVRILGDSDPGPRRLPTVSFHHPRIASRTFADHAATHGIGIRWGHFYSYRLLQHLGIDPETGICRISLAHYNTDEELDRLFAALDELTW